MYLTSKKEKLKIRKWDWLLIVGLCLSAMTDLRIWKIGPAELLCFIWGLRFFPKKTYTLNIISRFFITFLGAMLAGTFICYFVAPKELIVSDWMTWLFLSFIAFSIYDGLSLNSKEYNEKLFTTFCMAAAIWNLFLYLYSIYVSKIFFGARLWYVGVRFTAGAKNPHQVAVLMCGITFCFVRNIIKRKNILLNILGAIIAIFVEVQTASSTGIASIYMGFMTTILILTFYKIESNIKRISIISMELIVGFIIIIVAYPILSKQLFNWISSDANGQGRLDLFAQITHTFFKSPIFGLGPGMHALWGSHPKEYHNTYLEIIAASGIVGFTSFFVLTVRSLKSLINDVTLLPIMVAIYTYGMAGFAMRRLAYWGVFVFIIVIANGFAFREEKQIKV